jgi:hypothetical protein
MSNYNEYEDEDEYYEENDDEIESDDPEEAPSFPSFSDGGSEEENEEVIDLDDIEVEFDDLTEEQRAWILSTEAVAEFGIKFAEYIKEVNPELWKRARDYALDYVEVDGVEFNFGDDDDKNNKPT